MDEETAFIGLVITGAAAAGIYYLLHSSPAAATIDTAAADPAQPVVTDTPATDPAASNQVNPFSALDFSFAPLTTIKDTVMGWITPAKGQQYDNTFAAAEQAYGLPAGLLSRVAYQESRYNPAAKSPVGALGLMQFLPATAASLNFDPLDPTASIWAAGKYLKGLYDTFGDWTKALAAYNWGQGNVARKGLAQAPAETVNYYTDILGALGIDITTA